MTVASAPPTSLHTNTDPTFRELLTRLAEVNDLESAAALLHWDQATHMPPRGAIARGHQLATLQHLAHEKFIDPVIGALLEQLKPYEQTLAYDSAPASLLRLTRRRYDRALQIPPSFMATLSHHQAETYEVWTKARPANDFAAVRPYLEKMLDLSRELSSFFPQAVHVADPLIEDSDEGMTVALLRPLFSQLRSHLVPFVEAIAAQPPIDESCLHQSFPEGDQLAFSLDVLQHLGYDLQRGRQDKTHHPFMTRFSINDVRITTRVREDYLGEAFFSCIHEMGHAFYELGNDLDFERSPLAGGISSGVHESQSRLWENLVGRSRAFWSYFYPRLQQTFPTQLEGISHETFYRALNKVGRSLIRTDADEVTYNLHVMIRFDLELALLEGTLSIADLPEAWNERYRSDLGLVPPNDSQGVLQDVHWYCQWIGGMFQGYTLGNLMAAQFYEAALKAHPEIPSQLENGEVTALHTWLKTQIYQEGKKYTATELMERVTGSPLILDPFLRYLQNKFGDLYGL